MAGFTKLELAALLSIFSELPDLFEPLERQLEAAVVTNRRNTGAGFFTIIRVPMNIPKVVSDGNLGGETYARAFGLEHALGFILFMKGGRLDCLEGYTLASKSTVAVDLFNLDFEVLRQPAWRVR